METATQIERQKMALRLVEQIVELEPDLGTTAHAMKMRERLKLPMSVVLEKVWPELSVFERVNKLGISKQAWYGWLNGLYRPNGKLSKRLANLTGFDADEIQGKAKDVPRPR